jgi:hypothetical protein
MARVRMETRRLGLPSQCVRPFGENGPGSGGTADSGVPLGPGPLSIFGPRGARSRVGLGNQTAKNLRVCCEPRRCRLPNAPLMSTSPAQGFHSVS